MKKRWNSYKPGPHREAALAPKPRGLIITKTHPTERANDMKKTVMTVLALLAVFCMAAAGCNTGKAPAAPTAVPAGTTAPAATGAAPTAAVTPEAGVSPEALFEAVAAWMNGDENAFEGVYSPAAGAAYKLLQMGAVSPEDGWDAAKQVGAAFMEDASSLFMQFPTAGSMIMMTTGASSLEDAYNSGFAGIANLPAGADYVRGLSAAPAYDSANEKAGLYGLYSYPLGQVTDGGAQKTLFMLYEADGAGCRLAAFTVE